MRTRFTELLDCRVPIQLAGMGWVSGPELATAVAGAGGAGTVAPHLLPPPALDAVLDELGPGVVGLNVLVPFLDIDAVEMAAARLRYVEFFYGDPDPVLVARVHAHGALAGWQVGSAEEAVAAERAGCDFLIAQGVEAGGHVRGTTALLPLLSAVLDSVRVPVVAAGGIATARGVAAVLAAGADAARIGTRFLATPEADVHPDYQDALLVADAEDTVLTETFSALWPRAPHRVLRSCIDAALTVSGDTVGAVTFGAHKLPIPRRGPLAPIRATTGEIPAMPLYAGQGVGEVNTIRPAAEVVRELADGAARLLADWGVRQGVSP
ncbi:enoyl-[acyl-carrier protein] reductase II [Blastococcus aggregatus]|uniref:Enoyl-[acyl-carrier protein] reductase II n=1 Tax=Blastococcus aggregatus TaxID=38502 RepID=A0A285VIF1_9ACTN|nr:nitronate monooxygenase [Blastococcus aggregatus]SOC53657.1 enoyl-[acyl-carrier protein] reductase II [Blastococcus aggregatus]